MRLKVYKYLGNILIYNLGAKKLSIRHFWDNKDNKNFVKFSL